MQLNCARSCLPRQSHREISEICLSDDPQSTLTLNVPWHKMSKTKAVNFIATVFKFGKDVLGFMQIKGLESVFLHSGWVLDKSTAESVGALLYNMAASRPDVVYMSILQVNPHLLL